MEPRPLETTMKMVRHKLRKLRPDDYLETFEFMKALEGVKIEPFFEQQAVINLYEWIYDIRTHIEVAAKCKAALLAGSRSEPK